LAHEAAARFYFARASIPHRPAPCLRNARNCYERWGAFGKLRQLDERYPYLHQSPHLPSATATIRARVGPAGR